MDPHVDDFVAVDPVGFVAGVEYDKLFGVVESDVVEVEFESGTIRDFDH